MAATLPLSVFPPRCVNLTTEALTASCEHPSFDWLVPNLWTQGWPSGKSSPALSFLSLRKVSPRFPSPTHDKLMYDRGNVMARKNGDKHRPKAPSHSVCISSQQHWANSRRWMSCCHTWLSGTLGIWTHFSSFCAKYLTDSTISLFPAFKNALKWYGRNMAATKLPVS